MKKQTIFFILVSFLFFSIISCSQNKKISSNIDDWFKAGTKPSSYEVGNDEDIKYNNDSSIYLKSIADVKEGFGTIMRNTKPDKYINKRIKLTGYIKSENVSNWAGMWMRVDGPEHNRSLQFDNMKNRPIKGTNDWTKYEIVLDVPENSTNIAYGVLVAGNGLVWFSNMSLETVTNDIPITNMEPKPETIDGWFEAGSKPDLYEIGKDEIVKYNNESSMYLKSTSDVKDGFGTIMKQISPDEYIGKRIRMTGMIKSENVGDWAGMWMRVDGPDYGKSLQFDNMYNRPIKGTNDWTKYEIVLNVPENSTNIAYGVLVHGNGRVWLVNPVFEEVGNDVPTTNMPGETKYDYNKLPDKLENIPDGIEVKNTPDTVRATKTENDTNFYFWFHKTSVKALKVDLEITEFGSYSWISDHWEFSTVTDKPFTKKDFEDWYGCKDGKLIKGKTYTDKNNWYRNTELQKMISLWYYLGTNKNGDIYKGTAVVTYLPEPRKK